MGHPQPGTERASGELGCSKCTHSPAQETSRAVDGIEGVYRGRGGGDAHELVCPKRTLSPVQRDSPGCSGGEDKIVHMSWRAPRARAVLSKGTGPAAVEAKTG